MIETSFWYYANEYYCYLLSYLCTGIVCEAHLKGGQELELKKMTANDYRTVCSLVTAGKLIYIYIH